MSIPLRWAHGDVCRVGERRGRVEYVTPTHAWVSWADGSGFDKVAMTELDLDLPELPKEDA